MTLFSRSVLSSTPLRGLTVCMAWMCVFCAQGKAGVVCGIITDLFGQPLAGATIRAVNGTPISTTDSEGRYCLHNLPSGVMRIIVTMRGFHEHRASIAIQQSKNITRDFALTAGKLADIPPMSITGVVVDENGAPLRGGRVIATNCFNAVLSATAASDEGGRFMVGLSEPGQWHIVVWKPGYRAESQIIVAMPKYGQAAWNTSRDCPERR